MDKYVHAACFFCTDVIADIEIADFTGDLAVDVGCVKAGNLADAAFACEQVVPCFCNAVADRGNLT